MGNEDFLEPKDPFTMDLEGNFQHLVTRKMDLTHHVPQGNVDFDLSFAYGEGTATYRSCGANLNGEFVIIGGGSDKTQVNHRKNSR